VREPLPVGLLTEADIYEALRLTVRYLDDPEDPAFTPELFGAITAARAALAECADVLGMAEAGRQIAEEDGEPDLDYRRWMTTGEVYVARKVARRVIDQLRQWLPEHRSSCE
jgi:hypothetical protein